MATNRLGREHSPYLLQHQHNPVNWYAWGAEAFTAAREQQKPIFLSIGYATCYWCHVMEKDSFEREDVARVLNKDFICIKVDREERPDVDQIYMDAVVRLTGHGGWPMSVFLTPDLKPFWGGTFFYRDQFLKLLSLVDRGWKEHRSDLVQQSEQITQALQAEPANSEAVNPQASDILRAVEAYGNAFDAEWGGFGAAPKFPPAGAIRFLLRAAIGNENPLAQDMACLTLDRMAAGGIYDHLAGGFARYSVDARWGIPHFEKMLYDNALLAVAYLEAFQATQKEQYAQVARETLEYVLRDMTDQAGGFYSAEDAGEVGKEGEFYVFRWEEIAGTLTPNELEQFQSIFEISPQGNFEHQQNALMLKKDASFIERLSPVILSARTKLLNLRNQRPRPAKDRKILTSWNGLFLSALALGSSSLAEPRYLKAAEKAARFFQEKLVVGGRLLHRYFEGYAGIDAQLEDYAYLVSGLIDLYQAGGRVEWLLWARDLQREQDRYLWDASAAGYFFSSAPEVISKRKDLHDGATPSANSIALRNLQRLDGYFGESELREKLQQVLLRYGKHAKNYPTAIPAALIVSRTELNGQQQLVVAGSEPMRKLFLTKLSKLFLPDLLIAERAEAKGESMVPLLADKPAGQQKLAIYLCKNRSCQKPIENAEEALRLLASPSQR